MKIDLTSLKREKKSQVDLNFLLTLDTINYHGDVIKQLSPASVTGKLYVMNDKIFLTCEVYTEFQVNCSRCLKSFNYPMDTNISAELVREDAVEDEDDDEIDDLVYYQDDIIDLAEVVRENIILQLPMKMLCTENCRGLCSQCGGDLNLHQCECNSAEEEEGEGLDPRLAKLRKLLHQD